MANKFKKAVELRNSGEQEENNAVEVETVETAKEEIKEIKTNNELNLSDIVNKKEIKSKNKTFYLETTVIKAVEHHAKKQKVSDSKLVNDILKHVLSIKD